MKTKTDIREKIAVRAYFAWLNGSDAGAAADWFAAEQIEQALTERRAAGAAKAVATRRAKSAAPIAPAEMPVAAKRQPAARRPTAH